ncbi:MAG: DNA polymerase III subunit delta [Lachnospiraceae bacterium]|nr:DNA polymerase III subunit delta [Lachnospiraceae bacterium]
MKTILEHIKTGQFKNYYLLYGEERVLILQYRDRLKQAICPDGDDMNIVRFSGKNIDIQEVADLANTLPFFSEHRLIIIEDSGWFASSNDFTKYIQEFPDTSYFVFVEQNVDKRNKLYKEVDKAGYTSEFTKPKPGDLTVKIVSDCKKAGRQITQDAVEYIIDNAGFSYGFVCMELDKLLNYTEGQTSITLQDVQAICSYQAEDKIFAMIDAIGNMNQKRAVDLYHDLIFLRKPVNQIMYNLIRMVNILLQICEMQKTGTGVPEMAKHLGLKEGVVYKYLGQLKNYDYDRLRRMLDAGQEVEVGIRRGKYSEEVGLELLIMDYSMPES